MKKIFLCLAVFLMNLSLLGDDTTCKELYKSSSTILILPFDDSSKSKNDSNRYIRLALSSEITSKLSSFFYKTKIKVISHEVIFSTYAMNQLIGGTDTSSLDPDLLNQKIDWIIMGTFSLVDNDSKFEFIKASLYEYDAQKKTRKIKCKFDVELPKEKLEKVNDSIKFYTFAIAKKFIADLELAPELIEYDKKYEALIKEKELAEERIKTLSKDIDSTEGSFQITDLTIKNLTDLDMPVSSIVKLEKLKIRNALNNRDFQALITENIDREIWTKFKIPIILYSKVIIRPPIIDSINEALQIIEIRGFRDNSIGTNDNDVGKSLDFHWYTIEKIIREEIISGHFHLHIFGHQAADNQNSISGIPITNIAHRRAEFIRTKILEKFSEEEKKILKDRIISHPGLIKKNEIGKWKKEQHIPANAVFSDVWVRKENIPETDSANQRVTFQVQKITTIQK